MSQTLKVIAGRYRLESLVGEGGMASVWRAKDLTLARPVAVKLLYARDERDHDVLIARFLREARIAASVQHRNVIHIVDFGTTDEGQPFMVMELLEGESLGDRLHRERKLPLAEAVHIASMTLRGLSAVHEAGIIHRDLKPDNIFLKEEGGVVYPKILDFGISRSVEPSSGRRSALTTREGIIVGTPEYMSPEQARGLKELDRRTDLYSMGVILYQMLVGKLPLHSENVGDLIIKIVTSPVPLAHKQNPEIPMALSEVIAKAMAKLPQERYADAGEMQRAMHTAAESQLGELRRTLSDLPPASLTIPEDGIPIQRERSMLSREFPLGSTQDDLAAAGLATNDDDDDDDELGTDDDGPITTPNAHSEPIEVPSLPPTTGEFTARLSGRKRRPWLWPMVLLIAGGSLAFVVMRPEPEQIKTSTVAVPPVTKVTLRLRELPADATFTIDGEPVSGDSAELPKDGKARTLRVRAPGKQDWQAVYTASADWTYDVVLPDLPNAPAPEPTAAAPSAAPASPVAGTTEPAVAKPKRPASSAPVSATPARKAGKRKSPSALRDLDF